MRRLLTAFQAFFATLTNRSKAEQFQALLQGASLPALPAPAPAAPAPAAEKRPAPKPAGPVRSEAVTLLAALQREARFIDFLRESLTDYSDAQIGAAVRDIHRDCGKVLERIFAPAPLLAQPEGSEVEVPEGADPGRYHLTGNVAGSPPFRGRLVHHGWEVTKCELPSWSGRESSVRVIAPIEVEMK